MFGIMFESLWGSMHVFFCMPEHRTCVGFMAFFAYICVATIDSVLLYGQDKRHAHISWPVCCIHIHPRQVLGLTGCAYCCFMMTPGKMVFVVAHYNCSGVPRAILGALPRTTLSLQRCSAAGLFCFVHDAPADVSRHHYIQTFSPA